ncbi:hypothetical protein HK097_000913 [Rhizophlyctis rosea]|uniref:Ubiquitin-like domain-containing protein n=1 Tax=Rhizophlyctis rosea TaxID=64517 RepID=A0AAD5S7R2_9FUNG|nr:hypothetical protein HK097_000913 [Rhizophlyctis rosea]
MENYTYYPQQKAVITGLYSHYPQPDTVSSYYPEPGSQVGKFLAPNLFMAAHELQVQVILATLTLIDFSSVTQRFLKHTDTPCDPSKVLQEYHRFICLKILMKDENATILSPCPLIDSYWHQHILDTWHYRETCKVLGFTIDHNPDGGNNVLARDTRRAMTFAAYKIVFNVKPPSDVWEDDMLGGVAEAPVVIKNRVPSGLRFREKWGSWEMFLEIEAEEPPRKRARMESEEDESFHVILDHIKIGWVRVFVNKYAPMGKMWILLMEKFGLELDKLRILYQGERVQAEQTYAELGMKSGDHIEIMEEQLGC